MASLDACVIGGRWRMRGRRNWWWCLLLPFWARSDPDAGRMMPPSYFVVVLGLYVLELVVVAVDECLLGDPKGAPLPMPACLPALPLVPKGLVFCS